MGLIENADNLFRSSGFGTINYLRKITASYSTARRRVRRLSKIQNLRFVHIDVGFE